MLLSAREKESNVSIEMTPLIDMVFLLLIFFLVATTFKEAEREMQIALPFTDAAGPISTTLREIIINVTEDGSIIVAGQTMSAEQLNALVNEAVKQNENQKVTIRGDKNTAYQNIAGVLDVCKAAGIQEPYLDSVPR